MLRRFLIAVCIARVCSAQDIILEEISLHDIQQVFPLWKVKMRILDLNLRAESLERVCDFLRIQFWAFQHTWDNPNSRQTFGMATFDAPSVCRACNETDPADIVCELTVQSLLCGSEGIGINVISEINNSALEAFFIEDSISEDVSCDHIHRARVLQAQQAALQNASISFVLQSEEEHPAGDTLALDYSLPLRGQQVAYPIMAGSVLQLFVNGAQYAYESPGKAEIGNPFWVTQIPPTLIVDLPPGRHELKLVVAQPSVSRVVTESPAVTVDVKQRREDDPPSSSSVCRSSLLCRTLVEFADEMASIGLAFSLARYTALGFFVFGWFIPSRPFVPRGISIPWRRTLHVAVAHSDPNALMHHFEASPSWHVIAHKADHVTLRHLDWKVTVECSLGPGFTGRRGPQAAGCPAVSGPQDDEPVSTEGERCALCEEEEAGEAVTLAGRVFRFASAAAEYLVRERWGDYLEGSLSIPLDMGHTHAMLQRAEQRLWAAFVRVRSEEGGGEPEAHHVFSLLSAWRGGVKLAGPAGRLQQWASPACKDAFKSAKERGANARATGWGSRDVDKVRVREDLHAGGRARSMDNFGHEVYISHQYKFVWVRVLKAASSTIQQFLTPHFGAPLQRFHGQRGLILPDSAAPQFCYLDLPNAQHQGLAAMDVQVEGQQCLSREMLSNYFFFAFVRDPLRRFRSSLAQAAKRRVKSGKPQLNVTSVLARMLASAHMSDFHLETQALALASHAVLASPPATAGLPLDFIGRVEALEEDFGVLLPLLERHAGRPLPDMDRELLRREANRGGEWKERVMAGVDEEEVEGIAREVYRQDIACFG